MGERLVCRARPGENVFISVLDKRHFGGLDVDRGAHGTDRAYLVRDTRHIYGPCLGLRDDEARGTDALRDFGDAGTDSEQSR